MVGAEEPVKAQGLGALRDCELGSISRALLGLDEDAKSHTLTLMTSTTIAFSPAKDDGSPR